MEEISQCGSRESRPILKEGMEVHIVKNKLIRWFELHSKWIVMGLKSIQNIGVMGVK